VSWGTKGSDKAEALPSVSTKKGKTGADVVEDVIKTDDERENAFKEIVKRAVTKLEVKQTVEKPTMDVSTVLNMQVLLVYSCN
jgi:chitin synthase